MEHDDNNNNNNHGRNFGAFPSFRAMVFSCPGAVFRAGAAARAEAVGAAARAAAAVAVKCEALKKS